MKIIVTRPIFSKKDFLDFDIIHFPIFDIVFHNFEIKETDNIIVTSSIAIEILSTNTSLRSNIIYCVGEASRNYALSKGFENVICPIIYNVKELIKILPKNETFIYLRGEKISLDISRFLNIKSKICYSLKENSNKLHIDSNKLYAITCYSKNFTIKAESLLSDFSNCIAMCLSENIKSVLKMNWKEILVGNSTKELLNQLSKHS